ncbi:MAG: glycosyltransferase 87 family protein [Candidatus Dormibacteria bacterium]|jgi:hypothetical protein
MPARLGLSRRPPDRPLRERVGRGAEIVITGALIVFAAFFVVHSVAVPATTDLTGTLSASEVLQHQLGCPYSQNLTASTVSKEGFDRLNAGPVASSTFPFPFNEPSVLAIALTPLTGLPLSVAAAIFVGLILASLGGSWPVLLGSSVVGTPVERWAIGAAILLSIPDDNGLSLLQPEAVLLCMAAVALLALARHRDKSAGILLGCIALKPQLLWPAILLLLILRRWSAVGAAGLTALTLWAVSLIVLPKGCAALWVSSIGAPYVLKLGDGLPSLVGQLSGSRLLELGAELLGAAIVWFLLSALHKRGYGMSTLLGVAFAASIVFSLHTEDYDLVFLAPLAAALYRHAYARPWSLMLFGVLMSAASLADLKLGIVLCVQLMVAAGFAAAVAVLLARRGEPPESLAITGRVPADQPRST